ncbi:diguanylate cyclase [Sulfurimonas crateris]|uniref:Diguanylate cyclase n=1 Tax=Sulfurimonas crateris TaxID=2574727 RepID=A0A4U2Z947_9BACT|nr:CHASE domain-containing protein [Sulfurimonas crateris]TKI70996.1 diguanylate cyclase [Sulfurimonas crateris]
MTSRCYNSPISFSKKAFVYNRATVFLVFLFSILVAAAIWFAAQNFHKALATQKFEDTVHENIDMIKNRMQRYENILQSGVGFFHGSEHVSRKGWHDFIEAINVKKNYPGIQGIGFSKMIKPEDVAKVEQEMREEGLTSFSIRPLGEREIYSSILYLEPLDERNTAAIGYDMFSEPTRRAAMQKAMDSAEAAITGKVTLVQEIDEDVQPGILMYLPIYKKGVNISSIENRRKAIQGFIYSPFRMNDLMNRIVLKRSVLNFDIYDNGNISQEHLLYRSYEPSSYRSKFQAQKTIKLNNVSWQINFSSTKEFDRSVDTIYPLLMTAAGLAVQFFLLYIALTLFKSKHIFKIQSQELLKLSQALEQSPNTILITDLDGNIEYANRAFTKITGYTKDEAIGRNPRFLQSGKTGAQAYNDMWHTLKLGKTWHGEFINKNKNGVEYIEGVKAAPIFRADGTISHFMAIKEDITDKKRSEERINFLANFDSLTGLPNRFQLEERLGFAIKMAKRNSEKLSVMFLDLDNFKEVNDTLGHDAGDALLIGLSKRFSSVLREVDTVSRLGGDEFIFLLPNTDDSGASYTAEKLLKIIETPCDYDGNDMLVTGSIGIAIYPDDGLDQQTLFKNADTAMYLAKESGRNRYHFFKQRGLN